MAGHGLGGNGRRLAIAIARIARYRHGRPGLTHLSCDELCHRYAERVRDACDVADGNVALAALDRADVGRVGLGGLCRAMVRRAP